MLILDQNITWAGSENTNKSILTEVFSNSIAGHAWISCSFYQYRPFFDHIGIENAENNIAHFRISRRNGFSITCAVAILNLFSQIDKTLNCEISPRDNENFHWILQTGIIGWLRCYCLLSNLQKTNELPVYAAGRWNLAPSAFGKIIHLLSIARNVI